MKRRPTKPAHFSYSLRGVGWRAVTCDCCGEAAWCQDHTEWKLRQVNMGPARWVAVAVVPLCAPCGYAARGTTTRCR